MQIKHKSFGSRRKFGIEFELSNNLNLTALHNVISEVSPDKEIHRSDNWADTQNGNPFWHIKRDSTCGPDG